MDLDKDKEPDENCLIATAASDKYILSLYGLLGSLKQNWPGHPKVVVYDLGLHEQHVKDLRGAGYSVVAIPPFCQHWRMHYTWKIWCVKNTDADTVMWMDSGIIVLDRLDEVVAKCREEDAFFCPNYQLLIEESHEYARKKIGVTEADIQEKFSIGANFFALRKNGLGQKVIDEAYGACLDEMAMKGENPKHRQDQAIFSLLFHKYFAYEKLNNGEIYIGWKNPKQIRGQKIWAHRRFALKSNLLKFRRVALSPTPLPKVPIIDPYNDGNRLVICLRKGKDRLKHYIKSLTNRKQKARNGFR